MTANVGRADGQMRVTNDGTGSFAAGRWKCFAVRSQPKTDGIAKIGERQLKAADIQWAQGNLMQAEHLCHRAGYGRESATD